MNHAKGYLRDETDESSVIHYKNICVFCVFQLYVHCYVLCSSLWKWWWNNIFLKATAFDNNVRWYDAAWWYKVDYTYIRVEMEKHKYNNPEEDVWFNLNYFYFKSSLLIMKHFKASRLNMI